LRPSKSIFHLRRAPLQVEETHFFLTVAIEASGGGRGSSAPGTSLSPYRGRHRSKEAVEWKVNITAHRGRGYSDGRRKRVSKSLGFRKRSEYAATIYRVQYRSVLVGGGAVDVEINWLSLEGES